MFKNGQKPYLSVFVCFLLFAFALAQILPSSVDGSAGPASAFAKERKEQSYKHTGSSSRRHAASSERSRSRGSRDSRDEGGSGGQSGRESIGAALGAAAAATGVSLGTAAGSSGDDADAPLPGYQPPSDTSPVTLNPAVDVDGEEGAVTGEGQVDTSTALRDKMRVLAISGWLERPLIGHGFDSYKYLNADVYGRFYYSHCNYTELLYNGGIITLAVYYWMPVSILRQAFLQKKIDLKYRAFAIAAVLSLLAFDYGAVDYNVTSIVIMFMMAYVGLSIGKAQADAEEKRKQNEKKRRPRPSEVSTHE